MEGGVMSEYAASITFGRTFCLWNPVTWLWPKWVIRSIVPSKTGGLVVLTTTFTSRAEARKAWAEMKDRVDRYANSHGLQVEIEGK